MKTFLASVGVTDVIRIVVYAFAGLLLVSALAALGFVIRYNETPTCAEGSVLHAFTECIPGQKSSVINDPRP